MVTEELNIWTQLYSFGPAETHSLGFDLILVRHSFFFL